MYELDRLHKQATLDGKGHTHLVRELSKIGTLRGEASCRATRDCQDGFDQQKNKGAGKGRGPQKSSRNFVADFPMTPMERTEHHCGLLGEGFWGSTIQWPLLLPAPLFYC